MPITRYRAVGDMPPPWRDPDDPGNLRLVAEMLALHRALHGPRPRPARRVQRFRSIEEAKAAAEGG